MPRRSDLSTELRDRVAQITDWLAASLAESVDDLVVRGGELAERGREWAADAVPEPRSGRRRRLSRNAAWLGVGFGLGFGAGWLVAEAVNRRALRAGPVTDELEVDQPVGHASPDGVGLRPAVVSD